MVVPDLLSLGEARAAVLSAAEQGPREEVALSAGLGRVLAEDVEAPFDVPPFDSSAMDGYAVVAGPEAELEVRGESRAGHPSAEPARPGVAVAISTGAPIPDGADAVVPVERTDPAGDGAAGAHGRLGARSQPAPRGRGHPPWPARAAGGQPRWAPPSWECSPRWAATARCARRARAWRWW